MEQHHAAVSPEERERRAREAVTLGAQNGVIGALTAAAAVGAAHVALTRWAPPYRALSAVPKRIVAAVLVAGTFGYQSQRVAGNLAQRYGDLDSEAVAAADEAAAAERRRQLRGLAPGGGSGGSGGSSRAPGS